MYKELYDITGAKPQVYREEIASTGECINEIPLYYFTPEQQLEVLKVLFAYNFQFNRTNTGIEFYYGKDWHLDSFEQCLIWLIKVMWNKILTEDKLKIISILEN